MPRLLCIKRQKDTCNTVLDNGWCGISRLWLVWGREPSRIFIHGIAHWGILVLLAFLFYTLEVLLLSGKQVANVVVLAIVTVESLCLTLDEAEEVIFVSLFSVRQFFVIISSIKVYVVVNVGVSKLLQVFDN